MIVGSLFAGIGGFDRGFTRAGYDIAWQVELNAYCRTVLRKHWPHVRRYADVRRVGAHNLEPVDVICGGFPCQDISIAGAGAGLDGARSGLWREYARIIRELRPRYVVVENVPALLYRGLGIVLADLAACGYDAEWDCIPASALGAPHRRDRVWIVAYPQSGTRQRPAPGPAGYAAFSREALADADSRHEYRRRGDVQMGRIWRQGQAPRYDDIAGVQWRVEPDVGRVAHGVPARVDRLKGLGNAIVPQIAEWIAHQITHHEGGQHGDPNPVRSEDAKAETPDDPPAGTADDPGPAGA